MSLRECLPVTLYAVLAMASASPCITAQDIGDPMPPLHVTDWILGEPDDVGAWGDGHVHLVEFWGTWCAPCIPMIPKLSAIQDEYRDRGLVVIGYSWEERSKLERFVRRMGRDMRYVVVNDSEERLLQTVASTGSIEGFPYAFLVDRKGRIEWKGHPKQLGPVLERFFESR